MEANTNENRVVFRGNVTAVEDFTLCSDVLNILYDSNRDVSQIEASGNVRIFQDEKKSTAAKAVYDRKERRIVLTGDPQVTQCSDVIKGDRITVYLDDNNAVVESGAGKRVKAVIMPEKKCPGQNAPERTVSEEALCNGAR
jgi:lipopolysaccharide export system protein LptA